MFIRLEKNYVSFVSRDIWNICAGKFLLYLLINGGEVGCRAQVDETLNSMNNTETRRTILRFRDWNFSIKNFQSIEIDIRKGRKGKEKVARIKLNE